MTRKLFGLLLAVAAVVVLTAGSPDDGLTVHEWGTFTSVAGTNGKAIEWNGLGPARDLPPFVEDAGLHCTKWSFLASVRMETPVIYFYSSREMQANVSVKFPHGQMSEWYPSARVSSDHITPQPADTPDFQLRNTVGGIEWRGIRVEPGVSPALPSGGEANDRYYAARQTDSAPLTVGTQHEKFLFYRGLAHFDVPLTARVTADGKILVSNDGATVIPSAILFENRGGRVTYRELGAIPLHAPMDATAGWGEMGDAGHSLPELYRDLEETLVSQGLFRKEAHAMVETWKYSWFEEGSRIVYVIPRATVDALLPLSVQPQPAHTERVFVGRIELLTAASTHDVADAVNRGDATIAKKYGRFLEPLLARVPHADPAVAAKVQQLRMKIAQQGDFCR